MVHNGPQLLWNAMTREIMRDGGRLISVKFGPLSFLNFRVQILQSSGYFCQFWRAVCKLLNHATQRTKRCVDASLDSSLSTI